LLLHGNSGSIENFSTLIPELSQHFKVIAVDSRAQGRSSDSEKEITYALMASDMSELIKKLNFGSVSVAGFSDGGVIGLELAYAHPEQVKKLVTLGANYSHENYSPPEDSIVMNENDPYISKLKAIRKQRTENAAKRQFPKPVISPETKKKLSDLMEKYPNFTVEQLKQIRVPTLVTIGDHDVISLEHTIELYKHLLHSYLFIIPGSTHISLIEQPDLVSSEIIKFLDTPYRDIDRYYPWKIPK
jgi:pimeloyl-ACP methyl ester carboxylesterase